MCNTMHISLLLSAHLYKSWLKQQRSDKNVSSAYGYWLVPKFSSLWSFINFEFVKRGSCLQMLESELVWIHVLLNWRTMYIGDLFAEQFGFSLIFHEYCYLLNRFQSKLLWLLVFIKSFSYQPCQLVKIFNFIVAEDLVNVSGCESFRSYRYFIQTDDEIMSLKLNNVILSLFL
jgi:hypothetical protein